MAGHRLSRIEVVNFRSFVECKLDLADFTPLVGPNNVGKSNLLHALGWVLRFSALSKDDFNKEGDPVQVTACVEGVSAAVLGSIDPKHKKAIDPFIKDERLTIRRRLPQPSGSKTDCEFLVRVPTVADESDPKAWHANPAGIEQAIQGLFPEPIKIDAMQDAAVDVASYKTTTTIGKLLALVTEEIEKKYAPAITDQLKKVGDLLSASGSTRAPELGEVDRQANEYLADLFPGVQVRIHIPAPQVTEIFKGGTLRVKDDHRAEWGDIKSQGHGAQRSVQMALVRYLAEIAAKSAKSAQCRLLLIDEPELYLHPHGVEQVRAALKKLSTGNYQVIFTTHSPLMVGREDIHNAVVMSRRVPAGTRAAPRLADAVKAKITDKDAQADVLFDLTNSNQVLFTERILLVEGKTERTLVPLVYQALQKRTLGAARIGHVAVNGVGNIVPSLRILREMGLCALGLVDLDFFLRDGVTSGVLPETTPCVVRARDAMRRLGAKHGFSVHADGYPQHASSDKTVAWTHLAEDGDGKAAIAEGHDLLRAKGIWLWQLGAVERHFGLPYKKPTAWSRFAADLATKEPAAVLHDRDGCAAMLTWVETCAPSAL